jgi:hypothetical protein
MLIARKMIGSNVMSMSMNDTPLIWNDSFDRREQRRRTPRLTVSPPRQLSSLTPSMADRMNYDTCPWHALTGRI